MSSEIFKSSFSIHIFRIGNFVTKSGHQGTARICKLVIHEYLVVVLIGLHVNTNKNLAAK